MPRYPSPSEIEAIYAARESAVAALKDKGHVEVDDLRALDRLGRCQVAAELWSLCAATTREVLLHDMHPHVRACASESAAGRTGW